MTKQVKYSDILAAAKKRILRGHNGFVCHAIRDCRGGTNAQKNFLREWVMEMLGPDCCTYESWLLGQRRTARLSFDNAPRAARAHQRAAWIDYMIGYWKERGQ